jgi:cobaltochelatase CobS
MAWELNEKVLCYGPTGAGKSSLIEHLCALTGRPFVRVNCTGDMDSSMIFGQLTAKDGSTIWVDGAVTEAVKYGAVFAWDEWDVTPPEISMGLQWLLEDDGKLFLKEMPGNTSDKQIVPHENFRIVAIGNTQGQGDETGAHAGTNVQNSATLDRFGTAVFVDYLKADVEQSMLTKKFPDIKAKAAMELVKLANLIRQGYESSQLSLTVSPRSLISMCRKTTAGRDLKTAFALVYLNKLNQTQRKVAEELYTKVYGKY